MNRFKARIARSVSRGVRGRLTPAPRQARRRRSRYGNYDAPVAATVETSVIDQGSWSPFNTDRKLHRQAIKVMVSNPNGNPVVRVALSAGDHEGKNIPGVGNIADHLLKDGTNTYKATDGATDAPNVVAKASFGISGVQSVKALQDFIRNKGILIGSARYKHKTEEQLLNKLHFLQYDYMGDHGIDFIDPEVEDDPHQYREKDIMIPLSFVLNVDTVMYLDIEPNETIQLTLYMAKYQDLNRLLVNEARREGSNILL